MIEETSVIEEASVTELLEGFFGLSVPLQNTIPYSLLRILYTLEFLLTW